MRDLIYRPNAELGGGGSFSFDFGPDHKSDLILVSAISVRLLTSAVIGFRRLRLTLTESTGALTLPLWISRSKLPHAESLPAFYCAALNYRNDEMNAAAVVVLDDAVGMSLPRVVFRNDVRLLVTVDGFQAGDAISRLEIQAFSGTLEEILT